MKNIRKAFVIFFLISSPLFADALPKFTQGKIIINCKEKKQTSTAQKEKKSNSFKEVCLKDPISSSSDISYYEALKKILPDLKMDGTASKMIERRSEFTDLLEEDLNFIELEKFEEIYSDYLFLKDNDQSKLIILLGNTGRVVGSPFTGLALFQISPTFKLLDFIQPNNGPENVSLISQKSFLVNKGVIFFPLLYSHHNSEESYENYHFFLAKEGKIKSVYEGPNFYNFKDSDSCWNEEGIEELKALSTKSAFFADVYLKIGQSTTCKSKADQDHITFQKKYTATLRWDSKQQKYRGGSKDFLKHSFGNKE